MLFQVIFQIVKSRVWELFLFLPRKVLVLLILFTNNSDNDLFLLFIFTNLTVMIRLTLREIFSKKFDR